MEWNAIGGRIRKQREFLGYTRERLAELIDVTPKFCSDIELGLKGMSVPTLCRVSDVLKLSTDYILFGSADGDSSDATTQMLRHCPAKERAYIEDMIKIFLLAMDSKRS